MKKVNISKKLMSAIKLQSPFCYGSPYRPIFKVRRKYEGGVLESYYTLSTIKLFFSDGMWKNDEILSTEIVDLL